jgi:hypothetical protein
MRQRRNSTIKEIQIVKDERHSRRDRERRLLKQLGEELDAESINEKCPSSDESDDDCPNEYIYEHSCDYNPVKLMLNTLTMTNDNVHGEGFTLRMPQIVYDSTTELNEDLKVVDNTISDIILDASGDSYGVIKLTYKVKDLVTYTQSNTATVTIYVMPYSTLRVTGISTTSFDFTLDTPFTLTVSNTYADDDDDIFATQLGESSKKYEKIKYYTTSFVDDWNEELQQGIIVHSISKNGVQIKKHEHENEISVISQDPVGIKWGTLNSRKLSFICKPKSLCKYEIRIFISANNFVNDVKRYRHTNVKLPVSIQFRTLLTQGGIIVFKAMESNNNISLLSLDRSLSKSTRNKTKTLPENKLDAANILKEASEEVINYLTEELEKVSVGSVKYGYIMNIITICNADLMIMENCIKALQHATNLQDTNWQTREYNKIVEISEIISEHETEIISINPNYASHIIVNNGYVTVKSLDEVISLSDSNGEYIYPDGIGNALVVSITNTSDEGISVITGKSDWSEYDEQDNIIFVIPTGKTGVFQRISSCPVMWEGALKNE